MTGVIPTAEEVFKADANLKVMERVRQDPPLPLSPCLKSIKTGVIFDWSEGLAAMPDMCVNCDENGNEDPAAWQGRGPVHIPTPEMVYGLAPRSAPEPDPVIPVMAEAVIPLVSAPGIPPMPGFNLEEIAAALTQEAVA
jgi:hypothetical protein